MSLLPKRVPSWRKSKRKKRPLEPSRNEGVIHARSKIPSWCHSGLAPSPSASLSVLVRCYWLRHGEERSIGGVVVDLLPAIVEIIKRCFWLVEKRVMVKVMVMSWFHRWLWCRSSSFIRPLWTIIVAPNRIVQIQVWQIRNLHMKLVSELPKWRFLIFLYLHKSNTDSFKSECTFEYMLAINEYIDK